MGIQWMVRWWVLLVHYGPHPEFEQRAFCVKLYTWKGLLPPLIFWFYTFKLLS
jgi:hypothetical protein